MVTATAHLYLPVRGAAWAGSRLTPGTPSWMPTPGSFGEALAAELRREALAGAPGPSPSSPPRPA